jgi:hypothetical protein
LSSCRSVRSSDASSKAWLPSPRSSRNPLESPLEDSMIQLNRLYRILLEGCLQEFIELVLEIGVHVINHGGWL